MDKSRQKRHQQIVGAKIKLNLLCRNMTQAELAERTGITAPVICRIVKGMRPLDLYTARRLASELDVSLDELADVPDVEQVAV